MTPEEARIIAWTLLGEAAGEGVTGMTAVAHVIRNRAMSGRFPENPASVAIQSNSSGVYQFSTWNSLGNGGNAPRARYPAGSESFNEALRIVEKVFGPKPGADPTRGATHYYAPQGMSGGEAPYWWRSEAPLGGKKIGNHIFAVKYEPKQAPTPQLRPGGQSPVGYFPSENALTVLRTGKPIQLPDISGVKPTAIVDPITNQVVRRIPGQSLIERTGSAKAAQRVNVAGFSVPKGTTGIAVVDSERQLAQGATAERTGLNPKATSYVERAPKATGSLTKKPNQQTAFQPAGSVNPDKGQDQLGAGLPGIDARPTIQSGGLSRDAIAARAAGVAAAAAGVGKPPAKVAPIPIDPKFRPLPPVAVPPKAPLHIVVERDIAPVIAQEPVRQTVESIREERGYAGLVEENQRYGDVLVEGHSESGGRRYNPNTGGWL